MADEVDRPDEAPADPAGGSHHLPSPTIWPFGFAAGVALVLVGLIVSWAVVAVGAGVALVFAFLWIREATREVRAVAPPPPPAERPPAPSKEPAEVAAEPERFERRRFLEGATLGLGAVIGGVVTAPVVGFAIAPTFVGQGDKDVDLGPITNFPEGKYVIATFETKPDEGDVSRRTAFVRNNGFANGEPSFTIIYNRCVHLGCPTQPSGPPGAVKRINTENGTVRLQDTQPSGFSCPCHGGAYDTEGNRTAGPPVRSLDRYRYKIVEGKLVLTRLYSVGKVTGTGANAKIEAYKRSAPSTHVDGWEQYLYPYIP